MRCKKLLSVFLVSIMLLSILPTGSFAQDQISGSVPADTTEQPADTSGTEIAKGTSSARLSAENLKYTAPLSDTYYPGTFTITSASTASPSATTYRITDNITNSLFTVKYTVAAGKYTNKTVLVIDALKYGTQWDCTLSSSSNPNIAAAAKLSDTTYAILLADNLTGDVTIDFKLKYKALTQDQCIQWVDSGTLPATNLTAREYYMPSGTLANILTDPTNVLQNNEANFFNTDIVPENTSAQNITIPHTYNLKVSSIAGLTNYMMSENGAGRAGGTDSYLFSDTSPDPNLMYTVPTVHTAGTPLMEFSGIKVYVPDPKLKLTGVTGTPNNHQSDKVYDGDYYQVWNNWTVGARQTDADGDYYIITPPADTRIFNNGSDAKIGSLNYGMRLLWALVDDSQELDYSSTAYTQFQAKDSTFLYKIPNGSASTDVSQTYAGPKISIWARVTTTAFQAYDPVRNQSNIPNNNIVVGSYQKNKPFTYLSNTWYRTYSSSAKMVTEHVPLSGGAVTQTYPFPYEIQPESMTLSDMYQKDIIDTRKTVLGSVTYTTADGIEHSATAAEVTAINNYFSGKTGAANGIAFTAASATNRVTEVKVVWTQLSTSFGINYAHNVLLPITNIMSGSNYTTSGYLATVATNFTYRVTKTHEDGTLISDCDMVQSKYTADFADPAYTDFAADPTYLWWRLKVPICPTVNSEQMANGWLNSYYADGTSKYAAGNLYFYIGAYGERIDDLENPTVDFFTKFNNKGRAAGTNNLTGITEAEGLAFFSGAFTAMPKLSGWVFTYSTNQRTGVTWTVPTITSTLGTNVQIPLNDGEYFKSLSMTYPGTLSTAHASETDTNTTIYLMQNIMMRALNKNPFDGTPLNTKDPYTAAFIQLHGYAHWDNCAEEGEQHTLTATNPGQQLIYRVVNNYYIYPPELGIYFTRQARLIQSSTVSVPTTISSIYQGAGTSVNLKFTIGGGEYPTNSDGVTAGAYNAFANNSVLPWENIQEAVYLELTDPEMVPNLSSCTLYGESVASGNVKASIITVGGKTFLKLQIADGYQRKYCSRIPDNGNTYPNFSNNLFNNYPVSNAAGLVGVTFTTLPGTTTGRHYPVGDVYLDFTELLKKYDASNVTGYDSNRTNWLIAGNADNSDLTGSTAPDTNQLFKYSLAQGSSTAYAVDVIKATTVGAAIVPGKNNVEYSFSDKVTDFWNEERENLNALVSITGSVTNEIFDMNTYITIPRKGTVVPYVDGSGASKTATSDISLYLKGEPTTIGDSTGLSGNLHYAYTTDPNPTEASTYTTVAPTDAAGWAAVTGIHVTVDKLPIGSAMNLRLNLYGDAKTSLGDFSAYSAGTFKYKPTASAAYEPGNMSLITWTSKDYLVNKTSSMVFWDTYDENGVRSTNASQGESYVGGVKLELLDTDGSTVIDTAVTNASGQFVLHAFKETAGQSIRITMPTNAGTTVKLTKQSTGTIVSSMYDSDFSRSTNLLVLPTLAKDGIANISAGLVKLPQIVISDQTFAMGQTPTPYRGTLTEYLGMTTLPASPVYRLQYDTPTNTGIANFNPVIAASATTTVTPTIVAPGTTTARVWVTNTLGDIVEVTYNITVLTSYKDIVVQKVWSDNDNASSTRPSSVTLQLQRTVAGGAAENVGSAVAVISPWSYTFTHMPEYDSAGNKYTYSVVEVGADKNYTASYGTDASGKLTVTNTLKLITVSGVKTWDEKGAGFSRPSSITIHLYRDGVEMTPSTTYTKTVTAADVNPLNTNEWLYSFSGLLGYNPATGEAYKYTVQEDALPSGSNYNGTTQDMNITNMYPAKTYLTVTKTWAFGSLPSALQAKSATIALYRDGVPFTGELTKSGTVTLNGTETTPWSYTFEVNQADSEGHVFSFVETPIAGYTASVGAMIADADEPNRMSCTITNTYTLKPLAYPVTMTKAISGTLPSGAPARDFKFTLTSLNVGQPMPNAASTDSVVSSVTGAGTLSFGNITFTKAGVYYYTIQEQDQSSNALYKGYTFDTTLYTLTVTVEDINGNGQLTATGVLTKPDVSVVAAPWTVTNTYQPLPGTYKLGVNKVIEGDQAVLPAKFSFNLAAGDTAPLPPAAGCTATISGAGYDEFGAITFNAPGKYTYIISENVPADADKVEGYTYNTSTKTVVITVSDMNGQLVAAADADNADIAVTNIFTTPVVNISGTKTWVGYGTTYPTATINLWQNNANPNPEDKPYATVEIKGGATSYEFTNVPKYDSSGKEIVYTVTESPIELNNVERVGFDFKNTKIVPGTTVSGPVELNKEDHFAYIQGYPEGDFRPENNMTRAEATVMFSRLITKQMNMGTTYARTFSDVPASAWFANAVGYMQQNNIIRGYADGTFRPDAYITRAEFAALATRFEKMTKGRGNSFTDVPADYWAYDSINYAASRGWVKGYPDNSFKPDDFITRAEVVTMTNRVLERAADKDYITANAGLIKSGNNSFVEVNSSFIKTYSDTPATYWAYYDVIESSNGHNYTKSGTKEKWTNLK